MSNEKKLDYIWALMAIITLTAGTMEPFWKAVLILFLVVGIGFLSGTLGIPFLPSAIKKEK